MMILRILYLGQCKDTLVCQCRNRHVIILLMNLTSCECYRKGMTTSLSVFLYYVYVYYVYFISYVLANISLKLVSRTPSSNKYLKMLSLSFMKQLKQKGSSPYFVPERKESFLSGPKSTFFKTYKYPVSSILKVVFRSQKALFSWFEFLLPNVLLHCSNLSRV